MLTSGAVKLLDFGLAQERPLAATNDALETKPAAEPLTSHGTILGTLPYMAPEQVEGRAADARSDIFALGSVLYELLTGARPFSGASTAALAANILSSHPPRLLDRRPDVPVFVDRVVMTCLAKDPGERWQTAHDVALQLENAAADLRAPDGAANGASASRRRFPAAVRVTRLAVVALAGVALLAVAAFAMLNGRGRTGDAEGTPIAFLLPPPPGASFTPTVETMPLAVSPDGTTIAVVAADAAGRKIYLRRLVEPAMTPLEGTEGAGSVFWSPDRRSLGFIARAASTRRRGAGPQR